VATMLIRRLHLVPSGPGVMPLPETGESAHASYRGHPPRSERVDGQFVHQALSGGVFLHNILVLFLVIGVGSLVGLGLKQMGVILPNFIGPMLVAAVVRNVDDRRGWFDLNVIAIEAIGVVSLALFFVIALMDLKLWQLTGLAGPMFLILAVQIVVTVSYCVLITFVLMGRDYEAAVTTTGHIGFGLGITPNAVANMDALTARFGPAPRSFLIVPVVGAFFIDFSNPLIITFFVNLVG
jgi:ESS family glutamate:Na+ symporter